MKDTSQKHHGFLAFALNHPTRIQPKAQLPCLEVLVPLDQALRVQLPVSDLLAPVPLDALQQRRQRFPRHKTRGCAPCHTHTHTVTNHKTGEGFLPNCSSTFACDNHPRSLAANTWIVSQRLLLAAEPRFLPGGAVADQGGAARLLPPRALRSMVLVW